MKPGEKSDVSVPGMSPSLHSVQQQDALDSKPCETPAILCVDDEENVLKALVRAFRREGYRVFAAQSARAGLEILEPHSVAVIISDHRMPEMTGTEFLQQVKERYPNTVRILLSGYIERNSVTSAISLGTIYKFLTKPWDDEELRRVVREALAGQNHP